MRCKAIVPGYIHQVSGLLEPAECAALIADCRATAYAGPGRELLFDRRDLAAILWRRLQPHVPPQIDDEMACGLGRRFDVRRFVPGDDFAPHSDEPTIVDEFTASRMTLVVYLNDDFRGGTTRFRKLKVPAKQGSALLFRHDLEHGMEPITAGTKYVLRGDVLYRREGADLLVGRRGRDWPVGLVTGRHL